LHAHEADGEALQLTAGELVDVTVQDVAKLCAS
jgi:hypothetical protein